MTLTVSTELDAVNELLDAAGDSPVSTLTGQLRMEVSSARRVLRQTLRQFLLKGWNFNSDYEYDLTPTVDNEIPVPSNALSIDMSRFYETKDIVIRQGKLYNRTDKTFTFTSPVKADVIWGFEFDEIPEAARNYVTLAAARRFQAKTVGSDTLNKFTERDELDALVAWQEADSSTGDYNILTGTPELYPLVTRTPNNAGI